jgi:nitrite reductase/ring-hydroxylating ferredoxin subunit
MSDCILQTDPWVAVASLSEIDPDYPTMTTVGAVEIALCRVGEHVFAVNNICSHAYARLSDGFVEQYQVFCTLHQGSFDIRTGCAVAAPCYDPIATYSTMIKNGTVYVDVTRSPDAPGS